MRHDTTQCNDDRSLDDEKDDGTVGIVLSGIEPFEDASPGRCSVSSSVGGCRCSRNNRERHVECLQVRYKAARVRCTDSCLPHRMLFDVEDELGRRSYAEKGS